jgi:hypothetical protein
MAMAALAMSRRSITAIRRPNRVRAGAAPNVAVLGIGPFPGERQVAAVVDFSIKLGIPDARSNPLVCIAA